MHDAHTHALKSSSLNLVTFISSYHLSASTELYWCWMLRSNFIGVNFWDGHRVCVLAIWPLHIQIPTKLRRHEMSQCNIECLIQRRHYMHLAYTLVLMSKFLVLLWFNTFMTKVIERLCLDSSIETLKQLCCMNGVLTRAPHLGRSYWTVRLDFQGTWGQEYLHH